MGGQIISEEKVQELFELVIAKSINTWKEVHAFYDECQKNYIDYKARYALFVLETLYERPLRDFTTEIFADITNDVAYVAMEMLESSITSRSKDYTDFFRSITFRNKEEVEAVLGSIGDNSFLRELREATDDFNTNLERLFKKLRF